MKKITFFALSLLAIVGIIRAVDAIKIEGDVSEIKELTQKEKQIEEINLGGVDETNAITSRCQTATTSPQFLTSSTATTSCMISVQDVDDGYLNSMVVSTSTTPTLQYEFYISNERDASDRNWFRINDSFSSFAAATSSDIAVPYEAFKISDINYKFLKINYRVVDADANVYLEFVGEN